MTWWMWAIPFALAAAFYWQRRPLLFWLMATGLWVWLLRNVVRKLRLWCGLTRMTGAKYQAVKRILRPGYIIMGTDYRKPGHRATPGEMAHAALCVYVDEEPMIAEMVGEGYQIVYLSEFCFHYDRIVVARCIDWDDRYVNDVVLPACERLRGAGYDHEFKLGDAVYYCIELIHAADKEGRLCYVYESFFGRRTVTADSILKAVNVQTLCDTDHLQPNLSMTEALA